MTSHRKLAELAAESLEWMQQGACRSPEIPDDVFFPSRGGATAPAKRICAGCPVRETCLEYALEACEKFGVWGGMSERERRRIRRQRALVVQQEKREAAARALAALPVMQGVPLQRGQRANLTEMQIAAIRAAAASGVATHQQIADRVGLSKASVSAIAGNRRHVA